MSSVREKIIDVVRILEDQYPFSLPDVVIASCVNLPVEKVEVFLHFLAKYSFIAYDEQRKTAVVCSDFLSLK